MDKFQQFKDRQITTVGQLIEQLQRYPKDTQLQCTDEDVDGEHPDIKPYCSITESADSKIIHIGHDSRISYEAKGKGEITEAQYRELSYLD